VSAIDPIYTSTADLVAIQTKANLQLREASVTGVVARLRHIDALLSVGFNRH
jgi:hypothetical protein